MAEIKIIREELTKLSRVEYELYLQNKRNQSPSQSLDYVYVLRWDRFSRNVTQAYVELLLVGDAAHAFGSMLQNGAAQAFEDAYVLQDLLTDKMKAEEVTAFIDAFEKRRNARVQSIFAMSNAKIQAISNPEQIQGRNEAIRKLGAPNVNGFKLIMQQNP